MPGKLKRKNKQVIDSDNEEEEEEEEEKYNNNEQNQEDEGEWEDDWEDDEEEEIQQQQQKKKLKKNKNKNKQDDNSEDEEEIDNDALYKLLNVDKKATKEEIKKSYKKLALQLHPDKNPDPEAKQQFQKVKEAYAVLIDDDKRKLYDKTGKIGDSVDAEAFERAYDYFRELYKKIEQEDIIEFEKKYRHSEEEQQDLINFYKDFKGDMTLILETIMLSRNEDVDRYLKFFDQQIKDGKLTKYAKYDKTKKKIRMLEDESQEANQALSDLASQIMLRQQSRADDLFAALEAKYATKKTQKKKPTNNNKNPSKKIKK